MELNEAEAQAYASQGHEFIAHLAEKIQSSAFGMRSNTSPYRDRSVVGADRAHLEAVMTAWAKERLNAPNPVAPTSSYWQSAASDSASTLCVVELAMFPELSGLEFDWFAVDSEGNLALFATAGEGFIPYFVGEHHAKHSSVSASLSAPQAGTREVWNDYAALGLFVFDWALPGGPYVKQASAACKPSLTLKSQVLAVPHLPHFNGSFSAASKVKCWQ